MTLPGWGWSRIVDATAKQLGDVTPTAPISPSDSYLACLSKADFDVTLSKWFLFFDMIPAEAALLALMGTGSDGMPPPIVPTIFFHATDAVELIVLQSLGLKSVDEIVEASWYILQLQKGGDRSTAVVGDLYHPDLGLVADTVPDYGEYQIFAAELVQVPFRNGPKTDLGPPSPGPERELAVQGKTRSRTFVRLSNNKQTLKLRRYWAKGRYKPLTVARTRRRPPPAPLISAVGIMDIGQGGCNLLLDANHEPFAYYDVGYPLNFFRASLPPAMHIGGIGFQGPIYQNTANNLQVILSHWDYDHWALGRYVALGGQTLRQRPWTVPTQPLSPTQAGFLAGLNFAGLAQILPGGFGLQPGPNGSMIYECIPPPHAPASMIMNNSGLALRFSTWLPVANQVLHGVLLTADASFSYISPFARVNLAGITAVHHGSINHGASAGLPAPAFGIGQGFIGYSYGISSVSGNHTYGFPVPGAVANYQAAGWTGPREQTTAEAANINNNPSLPQAHGNIRMGDQTPLAATYNGSAFFPINRNLS
jgi:hypothetical protein